MHTSKKLIALSIGLGLCAAVAATTPATSTGSIAENRAEASIATAIILNRHLNPFEISVDVAGNTAILTGVVDESIDRELAEQVALGVNGIERVDNQIKVDSKAQRHASSNGERNFGEVVEDASITASVKSKLLWNSETEGLDMNVDTQRGVVTLKGNADNSARKELAGRIASNTHGVRQVINQLQIKDDRGVTEKAENVADDTAMAISDGWITTKVKSSLAMTKNVDAFDINVDTKDGAVSLSGTVSSSAERALAEQVARNIRGVKSVNGSDLRVDS